MSNRIRDLMVSRSQFRLFRLPFLHGTEHCDHLGSPVSEKKPSSRYSRQRDVGNVRDMGNVGNVRSHTRLRGESGIEKLRFNARRGQGTWSLSLVSACVEC